ncbi:MAG TPA: YIP1 family protein [Candidatus Angelobacter sp.]|nr:YIP1 family protein [Candidatus Angelobacter sp.]
MSSPTSQTPQPPFPNQPATPTLAPEPAGPGLSEPQRLINVFIAPSKTFEDIKRKSRWWVPWLILTLFGSLYILSVEKKVTFEAIIDARNAHLSPFMQRAIEQMPPEQKQLMYQRQINGFRRGIYTGGIFILLYGLLAAAVLTPTFNFAFDAGIKFKHALGVVFYGSLPRILWIALGMVVVFVGVEPEGFDMENPVATSLGAFLGINSDNRFLYRFLTAFDIFFIWIVVVIAIGFIQISARKKIGKGAAIAAVGGWYLLLMLCRAALSPFF